MPTEEQEQKRNLKKSSFGPVIHTASFIRQSFVHIPKPAEENTFYRRRLAFSIGISFLLNMMLIWLLLSPAFSKVAWFKEKPKPRAKKEAPQLVLIQQPPPKLPPSRPQTFLETSKNQAVPEKPKDADFYSEHNTLATQTSPSPTKSGDIPKVDGKNTKTMATETVAVVKKPSPPPSPTESEKPTPKPPTPVEKDSKPAPEQKPAKTSVETIKATEFAILKSSPNSEKQPAIEPSPEIQKQIPQPQSSQRSPPSPQNTTDREVLASQSKLEGGVPRVGRATAFNSAESPFAAYDKKVIAKIGGIWQLQIDSKRFAGEAVGVVEISFKLMADGKVKDLKISRNTANLVLAGWCVLAIEKSAPFEPFPESMRVLVGDFREANVTFAY